MLNVIQDTQLILQFVIGLFDEAIGHFDLTCLTSPID